MSRRLRYDEYTVGWICALPVELAAAQGMLDEVHEDLETDVSGHDENLYSLGSIGGHNVAIVCLPAGRIGNNPAAAVATQMRATFKAIRFGLMVGIGGGVPSAEIDLRLGDVVVSQPHHASGGVVQYDFGKTTPNGFERTGSLNSPPQILLGAVARVRANELLGRSKLSEHISKLDSIPKFQREKAGPDILFQGAYDHEGGETCDTCKADKQEARKPRESEEAAVHYGTIASGNQVIRDGNTRDKVSRALGGVLCFEMEAAGLMNSFPSIVIRGICDYADSHKNKKWQAYAAGTAAAYAKEMLLVIPPVDAAKACAVEETGQDSESLRQPKSSLNWTVPFCRDDDFIIRDSLDGVRQICSRPAGRAALVGLGGVGKSQIAIEYAYQVRDESPATWVFWVHAGTRARFEEGYRRIAEATKMDGWDNTKVDTLRLVRNWLCSESNGRWVMIVDNADDASVIFRDISQGCEAGSLGQPAELLSDFLPQSPNGSILITSRSRDVAYKLTGTFSKVIEVKPMDKADASALLQKKLGFVDNDEAIELIHALDFMPLALTQAAAFIRQRAPRMSVSRYIEEVRRSDDNRARLLKKDVGDGRRDGQASNSIIATWQISFEHIRRYMPTAARLLSLMSLFDRQGIPESLICNRYAGDDEGADFDDDIHTLISFSLIEMNAEGREFEMHRLVQFSTRKWLELYDELEQWQATYAALMDESYPVGQYENWAVCQALFPHAQAAMNNQPKDIVARKAWASVLFKAAWYASEIGQYGKAYEMDSIASQVREAILGAEHPVTLSSFNSLGLLLEQRGQYNDAEAMHRRVLEARGRVLRAGHIDMLTSMANLASTYWKQGRLKDAEELFVQVMESSKLKLGADHHSTLTSMTNLASTYREQGKWKDAEELEVQVMNLNKRKLGVDHPITLCNLANIGIIYRKQGRLKEAEELSLQVLEARKTKLGVDHPDTLFSMDSLGMIYRKQGRWEEAKELCVQTLETRKTKLGADHPDTMTSMTNLASTYWRQGRWKDAEELYVQVFETCRTRLGEDHPSTLSSISNLGRTYKKRGRWKDAEELGLQVLESRKMTLGADHPHTLTSMANLAVTYKKQARWKDAEKLLVQVIEIRKTKIGADHPDILNSMRHLASVRKGQGRDAEAIKLLSECVRLRGQILGASHPSYISSAETLAEWKAEQVDVSSLPLDS